MATRIEGVGIEFNSKRPPVPIAAGFAVTPEFSITASLSDDRVGPLEVEVDVRIVDGRARPDRVSVRADEARWGVGSTALRVVPIRGVLDAVLPRALWRVEFSATSKTAKLTPVTEVDDEVQAIVADLVGYIEGKRGRA